MVLQLALVGQDTRQSLTVRMLVHDELDEPVDEAEVTVLCVDDAV